MASKTPAIILCVIGVALALIPVTIYINAGLGSPLQRQLDTALPFMPLHLLTAIIGAAIAAPGMILFIKAMREYPAPTPAQTGIRPTYPPTKVSKPIVRGKEKDVELIERQLEEMLRSEEFGKTDSQKAPLREGGSEQHGQVATGNAKSTVSGDKGVSVITRGTDEVCRTCGSINPLGVKVCSECGASLYTSKDGEPTCPVCGAPLSDAKSVGDILVCQVCFSELKLGKPLS
ncbi:MAG: zinc ribbon domain-containing protein [Aigarchaeota archaeon]|nr:zinc ribbon domain-containing protein [Candidatus Pelearchaeum maunauluense]